MRRLALVAVLAGLVVVIIGALSWWRPFLTTERGYPASIPQPSPLYTIPLVDLIRGAQVCFGPAVMDTQSELAVFRVSTAKRPGSPINLTIQGSGYRFAGRTRGGYADNEVLHVPVQPPKHDLAVRICMRNAGNRKMSLFGANDQTKAPFKVTVDGKDSGTAVQFAFYERKPVSIAARLPTIVHRMQVFRPAFLGPWLFWPLAFMCVVGLPLGALWALWRAIVDDEYMAAQGLPLSGDARRDDRPAAAPGLRRAVDLLRGVRPRARRRSAP
ncbi:MAG TPA: hypothetical protein VF257_02735 [Solirubrobacteraceae bacterium]